MGTRRTCHPKESSVRCKITSNPSAFSARNLWPLTAPRRNMWWWRGINLKPPTQQHPVCPDLDVVLPQGQCPGRPWGFAREPGRELPSSGQRERGARGCLQLPSCGGGKVRRRDGPRDTGLSRRPAFQMSTVVVRVGLQSTQSAALSVFKFICYLFKWFLV